MNRLKWSFSLLILFAAALLPAETVRIRSGSVLAAEIVGNPVPIDKMDPDAFPQLPSPAVYAVLSLRMDSLRAISIFDYSLGGYGRKFPCVAILRHGRFEYTTDEIRTGGVQQLLFLLDAKQFGHQQKEDLILYCNLPPADGTYDTPLVFRSVSALSSLSSIPEAGMMEKGER